MANHATQYTVIPSIPNTLLCGLEGHLLMAILEYVQDEGDTTYFFCEEAENDEIEIDDDLIALMDDNDSPLAEKIRATIDVESRVGETFIIGDLGIDVAAILHALSHDNPDTLPSIEVQGCWHCSKMRPGEFGGFAVMITPNTIDSVDTLQWLASKRSA